MQLILSIFVQIVLNHQTLRALFPSPAHKSDSAIAGIPNELTTEYISFYPMIMQNSNTRISISFLINNPDSMSITTSAQTL